MAIDMSVYKVRLLSVYQESSRVKTLRFERPSGFSFAPGQFVLLSTVEVQTPKGLPLKRSYSICSPHKADYLEFCVALGHAPEGLSHYLHENAEVGNTFMLDGPHGKFILQQPLGSETVFIAGGTGIAPIRCMLHNLTPEDFKQKIWLFFGIRDPGEYLYRRELEELESNENFRIVPAISGSVDRQWKIDRGYISDILEKYVPDGENKRIYLCGPPAMVAATLEKANQLNFADENIRREQW